MFFPEPLAKDAESEYIQRFKNGDGEAKRILIERNLRLVAHVCKKYSGSKIDQDDLISIGTIGLIKGINSFNPDKNIKLATYTAKCIENAIITCWKKTKFFLKIQLLFWDFFNSSYEIYEFLVIFYIILLCNSFVTSLSINFLVLSVIFRV